MYLKQILHYWLASAILLSGGAQPVFAGGHGFGGFGGGWGGGGGGGGGHSGGWGGSFSGGWGGGHSSGWGGSFRSSGMNGWGNSWSGSSRSSGHSGSFNGWNTSRGSSTSSVLRALQNVQSQVQRINSGRSIGSFQNQGSVKMSGAATSPARRETGAASKQVVSNTKVNKVSSGGSGIKTAVASVIAGSKNGASSKGQVQGSTGGPSHTGRSRDLFHEDGPPRSNGVDLANAIIHAVASGLNSKGKQGGTDHRVAPPRVNVPLPTNVVDNRPAVQPVVAQTPRKEAPRRTPPKKNLVASKTDLAGIAIDEATAKAQADDLDKQSKNLAEGLDATADDELERLAGEVNGPKNSRNIAQKDKDAINNAIAARDPQMLRQAIDDARRNGAKFSAGAAEGWKSALAESNARKSLVDAVANGASPQDIAARVADYQKAFADSNRFMVSSGALNAAQAAAALNAATGKGNSLTTLATVANLLRNLKGQPLNTGAVPLPTGPVMAAWLPSLPAGKLFAVDRDLYLIGTGVGGEMGARVVAPAEVGLPIVAGRPVPDSSSPVAAAIILKNPPVTGATVAYSLDGQSFSMQPGYNHNLSPRSRTLTFDRGGGFGEARYTLSVGQYEFTRTSRGWDILSRAVKVTLDNSANPYDFHFQASGEDFTVKAHSALELSHPLALGLTFDRGDGSMAQKTLDGGVYSVGVATDRQMLDVFTGPAISDTPDNAVEIIARRTFAYEEAAAAAERGTPLAQAAEKEAPAEATATELPKLVQPPERLARRTME